MELSILFIKHIQLNAFHKKLQVYKIMGFLPPKFLISNGLPPTDKDTLHFFSFRKVEPTLCLFESPVIVRPYSSSSTNYHSKANKE